MYILEVSYGCPDEKDPLNGIFQMDQAIALANLGHQVVFSAIDLRSVRKWRKWGLLEYKRNGMPIFAFNVPFGPILPRLRTKIGCWMFDILLDKVIEQYGVPDIVHVHFGSTAVCTDYACRKRGIPFVITEHSSKIHKNKLTDREFALFKKTYWDAEAVIAVSNSLAKRINILFEIKARVIPNIVDVSLISSIKKVPHKRFRFVSAGNLNKIKGFDTLIKAFYFFLNNGNEAELLIMGDGPERVYLESLATDLNILDNITFYGRYTRNGFADELSKSDVFVLASRGETFGVVYAEAMASGLPIIATACGGPEDFITEDIGVLVSVDDIQSLSEAMIYMYSNFQLYDSEIIANEATNRFSSESNAKMITMEFNNVLDKIRR